MELLQSIIGILVYASLIFTASAAYLRINKIWIRKHHVEVADSVSIAGTVIYLVPLTLYAVNYALTNYWQGFIDSIIWMISATIQILIGSRLWVQNQRQKTFWTRIKESLKLERSEVGDLAKSFFRPSGGDIILEIFAHFAYIDHDLVEREKEFIQSFATSWHIDIDWSEYEDFAEQEQRTSFVKTRDTVSRYLNTSPPSEQVAQLVDVLHALVKVDDNVSPQEELILTEVEGLLLSYVDDANIQPEFTVVVAPQNQDQDSAISGLLPDVEKSEVAGGSVYKVGSYYSKNFADVICSQYRSLGFFTIDLGEH
jgi:hypothetical protein